MAKAKEVDTGTAIAVTDEEARKALAAYDYGGGDTGFEGGADAFKMPWMRIAQSNTPQVETVEGMKAGCIFNTVTNEFFLPDVGMLYIPAYFQQVVVEWVPRSDGGSGGSSFAGLHDVNSKLYQDAVKALGPDGVYTRDDEKKIIRPKNPETGNELVDTRYAWGLHVVPEAGIVTPSCMAFSSTHIGGFKNWYTMAKLQTYVNAATGKRVEKPVFAHVYRITSEKKTANGKTWYLPVVKFANNNAAAQSLVDPKSDLFANAQSLIATVKAGNVKIDYSQQDGDAAAAGTGGAGGKDADIPF